MTTAILIKENFQLGDLQFQRFSPLSPWWETWWRAGRHGAGEGAEISTSWLAGNKKWSVLLGMTWSYRRSQSFASTVTHFFNKTTPTPTRPHLLIVQLPLGAHFQSNHHKYINIWYWLAALHLPFWILSPVGFFFWFYIYIFYFLKFVFIHLCLGCAHVS